MRVLFCTTGGLGHLLPLRPLAAALRGRGHEIGWVTAPDALPRLAGDGFELFPAGPNFDASRREFRATHVDVARLAGEALSAYTFPRLFGALLAPAMLGDLERAVRRWQPDVVVHEPAALAVPLVCRQFGLHHVAHGYGLRPPPEYLEEAMRFFGPHWRERGLQPPADGGLYRHLYLDITPECLQPSTGSAQDGVLRFNPHRPAQQAPALPADLGAALAGTAPRRPRIYVSFGTVFNRSPALATAVRAAARFGATVVLTIGADGDACAYRQFGPHVHVHGFVEQGALLPHCDLVLSHGGAGTVLGAAAHGLPQLILPQAADHFRNARAIVSVSAGRSLEPPQQTVEAVGASLQCLLADGALQAGAGRLAAQMAGMPDAAAAASRLERWLGRPV